MSIQQTLITSLVVMALLQGCKKKDNTTDEPATPATPAPTQQAKLTHANSIGTAGTGMGEFNFDFGGIEMAWSLATDGNYVYVGDIGNNCVKKIDLSTNTVVGWYGYQNNTWGFYTSLSAMPDRFFKPFRLMHNNNFIYALSHKKGTAKSALFKFSTSASSTVDSTRVIPENSFFTATVDNNDNVFVVRYDSIIRYGISGTLRFGGFGSTNGKLNNATNMSQAKCSNDTLSVMDTNNKRIQKFSTNGTFISTFTINTSGYSDFCISDNKYYLMESSNFSEYTGGVQTKKLYFSGSANGFSPGQMQFVVINNKVVFQDFYNHKLEVYTK